MKFYIWCKMRGHRIVKDKWSIGHWCGCLDCGVQWTYYGDIANVWQRRLDEDAEIDVLAELHGIELPPLWRDFGHDAVAQHVRQTVAAKDFGGSSSGFTDGLHTHRS